MKLLSKTQVNIDSSLAKKKLIDEGLSIARKIDKMREEYVSLQKQRNDFIEGTKQELENQTTSLHQKLNDLKEQIRVQEEVYKELIKPLTERENLLKINEEKNKNTESSLEILNKQLRDREVFLKDEEAEADKVLNTNNLIREEFERMSKETKQEKLDADTLLKDARDKANNINKVVENRLTDLIAKEKLVEFNRIGVENVQKRNDLKEQELNERERVINDKYNTFQRNLERLKK